MDCAALDCKPALEEKQAFQAGFFGTLSGEPRISVDPDGEFFAEVSESLDP
jgi:hypothetical protein